MTSEKDAMAAVSTILRYIEGDDSREGLIDTPRRVIDSFSEIYAGYGMDAAEVLSSTFNGEGYDGIVLLRDIEFHSTCEHHLQPFKGRAHVAYIPTDRIVGISKLARIVELHARRLQNQERITSGIANDLEEHLKPSWLSGHNRNFSWLYAVQRCSKTKCCNDYKRYARRVL